MNLLKKLAGVFMTYSVCYALLVVTYTYFFFKGSIMVKHDANIALMLMAGVFTMDFFGPYINEEHLYQKIPKDIDIKAEEMECFGLFLIANTLGKEAACILSIVDSPFYKEIVSSEDREIGLNNMLKIALDAITSK